MTAQQQILILTSNTGGGHRSAAQALENSFLTLRPDKILVGMTQVLEESTVISRKMAEFYNFLLRDHQSLMKYYYWAIEHLRPNESAFLFQTAMGYGKHLFEKICPQALVSVHPMTQHFFAYILKRLNLLGKIPFVTVVTDPCSGFWRGWACPDVDRYYVASEEAKDQLMAYGVGSHKIAVMGMPVHSRFYPAAPEMRHVYRQELGLDAEKFTVFVNAGWAGGGNIPKIFQELTASQDDIQLIYLCGRNEKARYEAHQLAEASRFPIKVVGYTPNLENLMNASDLMVTKFGGLTTFEALSCGLPIIGDAVTEPMPQERQTAKFIERSGAGILLRKPEAIIPVIHELKHHPYKLEEMRNNARQNVRFGAADRIAQDVLHILTPSESNITELNAIHPIRNAAFA